MSKNDKTVLLRFLPQDALEYVDSIVQQLSIDFRVVNPRKTKLGDCRYSKNSKERTIVTINSDLPKLQFLITTLHELAHAAVFRKHQFNVAAHGVEWKNQFSDYLKPILDLESFNLEEKSIISEVIRRPKATSAGVESLHRHLSKGKNITLLKDIDVEFFNLNGKRFKILKKNRTRFVCEDRDSGRKFTVHGLAEVTLI